MENNFAIQIRDILKELAHCYAQRNEVNADGLMKRIFHIDTSPVIIGTSLGELCIGYEECKGLFISDWESWGNVDIDTDSVIMGSDNAIGWFTVKATVQYSFQDSEEKYASYINLIKRISASDKTEISKANEVIWFLSHLLHSRDGDNRLYCWDIIISAITESIDGIHKIRSMQFLFPMVSPFPDNSIGSVEQAFNEESAKILKAAQNTENDFLKEKLSKALCSFKDIRLSRDNSFFIGFDGLARKAEGFMEYIEAFQKDGVCLKMEPANILLGLSSNNFYFCGTGVYLKDITADTEIGKVLKNISEYEKADSSKEALFKIRRDLAQVLKETAGCDTYSSPLRIEGVGRMENELICFSYLQLSFPFYWILEQKTNLSSRIK